MLLSYVSSAFVTNSLMNPIWMVKTRMQLEKKFVHSYVSPTFCVVAFSLARRGLVAAVF